MNTANTTRGSIYVGLFLISLSTLMYEILLTRIFSVTMWYHFAFMAVSIALFGMTAGATLVYLRPDRYTRERTARHLATNSYLFALSIPVSFLAHLHIPFGAESSGEWGLLFICLTYALVAVPFVFGGIAVCLALTKYPRKVSMLYAADLTGAAAGCLLLVPLLDFVDGPTAVVVVGVLAMSGSAFMAFNANAKRLGTLAVISGITLGIFSFFSAVRTNNQLPLIRLKWTKGGTEEPPLYEKWNAISRILVHGDPSQQVIPREWTLSYAYPRDKKIGQLVMTVDSSAATQMIAFDGDPQSVEYLKYDVANMAHHLRSKASVLVVGSGGGRDVLSALAFDQREILALEINKDILDTVNGRFGGFTGHLDRNPRVTFVNDEARSYVTRLKDRFDIIQVSLIDTWAATAAGGFVLSENALYTVDAWKILLEHLTADGILSFTRWYFRGYPAEMYRLTSLANSTLRELGIANPRDHMVIVRHMLRTGSDEDLPHGSGTVLVSREPFSASDLEMLAQVARALQFEIVLTPMFALDSNFARIAAASDADSYAEDFRLNIVAPTDDSPFFFHMLRLRDIFDQNMWYQGLDSFNLKAVSILGSLLITVVVLTLLFVFVPLLSTRGSPSFRGGRYWHLIVYFAAIGLGFMLIEISQMQKLMIFLGHPIYGLSTVLFALLLSSGLGSLSTNKFVPGSPQGSAKMRIIQLLCVLLVFGAITPTLLEYFQGASTSTRITVSVGTVFPMGYFMGMAFPMGIKIASSQFSELTPWLWGINGATSICGSVLAVGIAMFSGISTCFWSGCACYAVALFAFTRPGLDRNRSSGLGAD